MDNPRLIEKCLAKDPAAWDEFTRRYYGLVGKCVRYKVKIMGKRCSKHLVEDITQDIFMMLWESGRLANVQDPASIRGWLAIVSINFTGAQLRKKIFQNDSKTCSLDADLDDKKTTLPFPSSDKSSICSHPLKTIFHNDKSPEERDIETIVKTEISKLVPKQALALKLNLLDGLAQKDIARLLKIPENTAATIIRRGKLKLSKRLKILLKLN